MINKIKSITRGQALLFLLFLLIGLGIFIGIKIANVTSIDSYKAFEKELEVSAKNYIQLEDLIIEEDEQVRISLKKLDNENLVTNDLKDKCTGYVLVSNEEDPETEEYTITYEGNIKCGSKYVSSTYYDE